VAFREPAGLPVAASYVRTAPFEPLVATNPSAVVANANVLVSVAIVVFYIEKRQREGIKDFSLMLALAVSEDLPA
jgi:hypothetical protein